MRCWTSPGSRAVACGQIRIIRFRPVIEKDNEYINMGIDSL